MISPDQPSELGSHSSKKVLDCEGFFIAQTYSATKLFYVAPNCVVINMSLFIRGLR